MSLHLATTESAPTFCPLFHVGFQGPAGSGIIPEINAFFTAVAMVQEARNFASRHGLRPSDVRIKVRELR